MFQGKFCNTCNVCKQYLLSKFMLNYKVIDVPSLCQYLPDPFHESLTLNVRGPS